MDVMSSLSLGVLGWWLLATMAASVLGALVYPMVRRWLVEMPAALRASVRLVYVIAAPAAALFAVISVTQPGLAGRLVPAHCHGDICGVHAPVYASDSIVVFALAVVSSAAAVGLLGLLLWAARRAHQRLRVLQIFTRRSAGGYRTLDSADMLAFCAGLWRPQIVLSRGLLEQLGADERAVVLAHERAHCARYDNLRMLVARWSTLFWPPRLGGQLLADLRADAEQACDHAAARSTRSTARVVCVIRKLSELMAGNPAQQSARSVGFDCADTASRIAALESGLTSRAAPMRQGLLAALGLSLYWSVQMLLLIVLSHQVIEWLGSLL